MVPIEAVYIPDSGHVIGPETQLKPGILKVHCQTEGVEGCKS